MSFGVAGGPVQVIIWCLMNPGIASNRTAADSTLHLRKHDPKMSLCLHAMAVFAVHVGQAQNKYTKKSNTHKRSNRTAFLVLSMPPMLQTPRSNSIPAHLTFHISLRLISVDSKSQKIQPMLSAIAYPDNGLTRPVVCEGSSPSTP